MKGVLYALVGGEVDGNSGKDAVLSCRENNHSHL